MSRENIYDTRNIYYSFFYEKEQNSIEERGFEKIESKVPTIITYTKMSKQTFSLLFNPLIRQ